MYLFVLTAVCKESCKNGGTCIMPNRCKCTAGFVGRTCEDGKLTLTYFIHQSFHGRTLLRVKVDLHLRWLTTENFIITKHLIGSTK